MMIDRKKVDEALREAEAFIGQKRIWKLSSRDAVVTCTHCHVTLSVSVDETAEGISVAPQIWCEYIDCYGKVDTVWFAKGSFSNLPIAD